MSIFSLFTSRKPDVSKYAFVDTEVGTKDLLMDEIGRWNQLSRNQKKIFSSLLCDKEEFKAWHGSRKMLLKIRKNPPFHSST